MKNYILKKILLLFPPINFLIYLIIFIWSFLFFTNISAFKEENNNVFGYYSYFNSNLDIKIPSPTEEQVLYLQQNSLINEIQPFVYSNLDFEAENAIGRVETLFFNSFPLKGVLYSEDFSGETESIFQLGVDITLVNKYNFQIGDNVIFKILGKSFERKVTHIIYNNPEYSKGHMVLILDSELKNIIYRDQKITYSSAYIDADDVRAALTYLQNNYKPLGRLGSNYTPEMYDLFIAEDFSNEILDISFERTTFKNTLNKRIESFNNILFYYILSYILVVSVFFLLSNFISSNRDLSIKLIENNNSSTLKLFRFTFRFLLLATSFVLYLIYNSSIIKPTLSLVWTFYPMLIVIFHFVLLILFSLPKKNIIWLKLFF